MACNDKVSCDTNDSSSLLKCRPPLANSGHNRVPEPASNVDMLIGPRHLVERHQQHLQQQQQKQQDASVDSGSRPQSQQQASSLKPSAAKQTTLLASTVRCGSKVSVSRQPHGAAAAAASVAPAGDKNASSKAKAAGKAQVAKEYIVQLRTELPGATFRYACVLPAIGSTINEQHFMPG